MRRTGIGRFAVTILLLLAFTFQSYVTQTHIHRSSASPAQSCISKCVAHAPGKGSLPSGETTNDCPLCQAIVHAGAFFTPTAAVLFIPHLWVQSTPPAVKPTVLPVAQPRNGQSRAPPR